MVVVVHDVHPEMTLSHTHYHSLSLTHYHSLSLTITLSHRRYWAWSLC